MESVVVVVHFCYLRFYSIFSIRMKKQNNKIMRINGEIKANLVQQFYYLFRIISSERKAERERENESWWRQRQQKHHTRIPMIRIQKFHCDASAYRFLERDNSIMNSIFDNALHHFHFLSFSFTVVMSERSNRCKRSDA